MKRTYGIGFLICFIFLLILFVFLFDYSYNKSVPEKQEQIGESYCLKDRAGYVTVYVNDNNIYEYTSIKTESLPAQLQQELKTGLKLENIADVYGFLENYSS